MDEDRTVSEASVNTLPRPGIPLIVCSVLVIAACVLMVSIAIALFAASWNPCALIGGLVFLPPFGYLGMSQYRATFRQNPRAATVTSVILLILGAFSSFGVGANIVEGIVNGMDLRVMTRIIPMMLVPTILFLISSSLNRRWARRLRREAPNMPGNDQRIWRFSTRELLLATTVVAVVSALSTYFIRTDHPRFAEHVALADAPFGLPQGSTDICYARAPRGTIAYEFKTDKATFQEWVADGIGSLESQAANVPLKPIGAPFTMRRYYILAPELGGPDSITISQGLYYQWTKEDRGVYAAFDSQTDRAYFYYHGH